MASDRGTPARDGAAGPPSRPVAWADELRNALALAVLAALYALLAGGFFHLVPPSPAGSLLRGFATGYLAAALLFVGSHALASAAVRLVRAGRDARAARVIAPLTSLVAAALALPALFTAPDLAALLHAASFLGANLALSATRGFYAGLQRRLVPGRRLREALAARPALGEWLIRWIEPLLALGRLLPWFVGGIALALLPPALRVAVAGYVLVLTYLAHLTSQKLLEELAVWVFLHALRAGDFVRAARLSIRASRLAEEIAAAPPDLEAPFAAFIAAGCEGLEGLLLTPLDLKRLRRAHLAVYGLAAAESPLRLDRAEDAPPGEPSLVRRLLDRDLRFRAPTEPFVELEPLPLPGWRELLRPEARARIAALYPEEPLWQVIARLYEISIRGSLLPLALLWLPLLIGALFLVGRGPWAVPAVFAALSFALLLWLTVFYGNWVFDQSLRRHDFPYLARLLARGQGRGELEDALGARDARVRDRAVELLLFDDEIARLGITPPPAGMRKFRRRTG